MIFEAVDILGAMIVDIDPVDDERGFFARTWCAREFEEAGLSPRLVQCSVSFNRQSGTLRGLHYQAAPHQEAKLVRCTMGSIYDVVVDLRPESATYLRYVAVLLTADNRRGLYVPEGCAHGFQTLEDDTEVLYQMTEFYEPSAARGVRWNDPAFGIDWPMEPTVMSAKDRSYPALDAHSIPDEGSRA